jgi:hypothetical protein
VSAVLRGLRGHPAAGPVVATIGPAPLAGPADPLSLRRLRHAIVARMGEVLSLDAHLALIDTRGAWYAWHAVNAWEPDQGEALFGLVRHVVRTQLAGPPPAPDVEGWLAAGRPRDRELIGAWDQVLEARWPNAVSIVGRQAGAGHSLDAVVTRWPAGQFAGFVHAYATVEATLERHAIQIPPVAT